jgi:hypothetical protein
MWEASGIETLYQSDDAPRGSLFSYAKAINLARKKATGDWFLSYSVDALPPSKGILGLLDEMIRHRPWVAGFHGQVRFDYHQTELILRGTHPRDKMVGQPAGGVCIGREALVAVRADVWDDLGGYDERFIGWGPEDKAWHHALKTIFPNGWDHPTDEFFRTLWHPPVTREKLPCNQQLFQEYLRHDSDPMSFRRWYFETVRRHNSQVSTQ